MFRTALLLLSIALFATPALAAEKRVYKIDSVIATLRGGVILIQVKGAVQTGGWVRPRLHVLRGDGHAATFEFLATPPPSTMTVIEALVPVAAAMEVKARRGIASVRVAAEANEITTQVLP